MLKILEGIKGIFKKEEAEQEKDVSVISDIIQALLNTASIEHHSLISYFNTQDEQFLELREIARKIRRKHLDKIVKESKAEIWCLSKHILLASMAYMELGDRDWNKGNFDEAKDEYSDAEMLINLFGIINKIGEGK